MSHADRATSKNSTRRYSSIRAIEELVTNGDQYGQTWNNFKEYVEDMSHQTLVALRNLEAARCFNLHADLQNLLNVWLRDDATPLLLRQPTLPASPLGPEPRKEKSQATLSTSDFDVKPDLAGSPVSRQQWVDALYTAYLEINDLEDVPEVAMMERMIVSAEHCSPQKYAATWGQISLPGPDHTVHKLASPYTPAPTIMNLIQELNQVLQTRDKLAQWHQMALEQDRVQTRLQDNFTHKPKPVKEALKLETGDHQRQRAEAPIKTQQPIQNKRFSFQDWMGDIDEATPPPSTRERRHDASVFLPLVAATSSANQEELVGA